MSETAREVAGKDGFMAEWCWQQQGTWPQWTYEPSPQLVARLEGIRATQDALAVRRRGSFALAAACDDEALVQDAWASSWIEGEHFDSDVLMLALSNEEAARAKDGRAPGVMAMSKLAFDSRAMNREVLCAMHDRLMSHLKDEPKSSLPTGFSIGAYRQTPIFVRAKGRGVVYEGPPPERVDGMMSPLLQWAEAPCRGRDFTSPLREPVPSRIRRPVDAAIAHLWFESIHPFSDGNGRIGRALADRMLNKRRRARGLLSMAVLGQRDEYYLTMNACQRAKKDITPWVEWFVGAVERSLEIEGDVTRKAELDLADAERASGRSGPTP